VSALAPTAMPINAADATSAIDIFFIAAAPFFFLTCLFRFLVLESG
jgi:hypothetical protein